MASSPSPSAVPRITVLGSLNIDLVSYVPHHPLPGETLTATSVATSPGGKGANQAVAVAKLSRSRGADPSSWAASETAHVSMVGAVGGADPYGALLRDNLARHGVDVAGVREVPGDKTGMAIIVVDEPTGQNRIILSAGANGALRPEGAEALWAEMMAATPGGGGMPDMLIMQLEIPVETVVRVLALAREAGTAVLLNPAPAVRLPAGALRGVEHFVVNETEAAVFGGVAVEVLDDVAGLERVARGFVDEEGVGNVIITLGGRGVFYFTRRGGGEEGHEEEMGLVEAEKATVVDTTAAGDTFVGAYALAAVVARKEGTRFDVAEAVRGANRAAARTVERAGAQDSIPWRDELV